MQTLYAQAESTGQDSAGVCIALDGDKLKPRVDQRKGGNGFDVNEDGAGYTLTGVDRHGVAYCSDGGEVASTITRQISEQSGQDNRVNAVVQCADGVTLDAKNGFPMANGVSMSLIGGTAPGHKNAVVSAQGLDGYNKTLAGGLRPPPHARSISTNSNGEDVAATINANEGKMGQQQKDVGGGTS